MVKEKIECSGLQSYMGKKSKIEVCARYCLGKASMFIFGTNDFGENRCETNAGCDCYCETSAAMDGTCNTIDNIGYRLYKFYWVDGKLNNY